MVVLMRRVQTFPDEELHDVGEAGGTCKQEWAHTLVIIFRVVQITVSIKKPVGR